jgi:hypothetical protein
LTNFATFLRDRGLVNIGDVKADDVQVWRDGLEGAAAGRRKRVIFVMAFFNYCVDFGKLLKSPAIKSQLRRISSTTWSPHSLRKRAPTVSAAPRFDNALNAAVCRLRERSTTFSF